MTETIISSVIRATHNRMLAFDLRKVESSDNFYYELESVLIGDEGIENRVIESYSTFKIALAYYRAYLFELRPIIFPLDSSIPVSKSNCIHYYIDNEFQAIEREDAKKNDN